MSTDHARSLLGQRFWHTDIVARSALLSVRLCRRMRGLFAATVLALSFACKPVQASSEPAASPFAMSDVFRLKHAEDIQISPDGRWVAYVLGETDIKIDGSRRSVMVIDTGTRQARLLALNATLPRWSPDSRRIAFVPDGSAAKPTIVIANADDLVTHVAIEVPTRPSSLEWSPLGQALAFTGFVAEGGDRFVPPVHPPPGAVWAQPPRVITASPYQQDGQHAVQPGHLQLFTVASVGGTPRQLTTENSDVAGKPTWTADGKALLFAREPNDFLLQSYHNARIFRIAAEGGTVHPVTPETLGARAPAVSSDGRFVAFLAAKRTERDYEPSQVYLMRSDGRDLRALASDLDRESGPPIFAPDSRSVYVAYGDQGETILSRLGLDGSRKTIARHVGGDGGFSLSRNGIAAYPSGRFDAPSDVIVIGSRGPEQALTNLNKDLLVQHKLATVERLDATSPLDGARVASWLVLPPGHVAGVRHPLILSIHGGPYGYDEPTWDTQDQIFAAAGYAILHVNYRGSTSYGFAFADRIAHDYPNPSFVDLMAGVDAAIASGTIDPDRLFVTGGSAGGMLTAWIVGRTDRFKAAVAVKPVINETSEGLVTDQFSTLRESVGALPWEDPQLFWKRSPLALVEHVRTPTLLMVGDEDHRTPVSEAEQFFDALQLRRIPSALVIVPDAGHDSIFGTPSRLVAGAAIILDWFARHGGMPAQQAMVHDARR